ncbi:photosystem II biogenesis protein Psp29 [Chamaesiphon sp. VAR_48_metabat_135_sub]|uniref:photosystem II biogenesis protein Psp29 n=1 Tax=Chamaesiphon sp. VAR_48_metabat_135_sub TaxID=2964699 RepID=UPI00286C897E|nr:photosystem II biogenesis protein Psp29 [Chamaesiphon sp. VAR_48_metabat_135_sub]
MNNLSTVSDTKRNFYSQHTRPINSIYRRVVEELMVEMHLLSTNVDFDYNPVYALGVVSSFDRFMASYRPDVDKQSIFVALCQSMGGNAQQYRTDAAGVQEFARSMQEQDIVTWLAHPTNDGMGAQLASTLGSIASNPKFKYSRLFGIGLFTILEQAAPDLLKDEKKREAAILQIGEAMHLPTDKLQKDLDTYRSNLDKLVQMEAVMGDLAEAERKKREKRAQEKADATAKAEAKAAETEAKSE